MPATRESLRAALRAVPHLAKADDASLDVVASVLKPRRMAAGARLFEQGAPGDSLFIVVSGRLTAQVAVPGLDVALAEVGPGGIIGELACLDPGPRAATLTCTEASELLELDRILLQSITAHAPELGSLLLTALLNVLAQRLRITTARLDAEIAVRGRPALPPLTLPPPDVSGAVPRVDLRKIELLRDLEAAQLQTLVSEAAPRRLRHGAVLFNEGDPGDSCVFLAHGRIVLSAGSNSRPVGVLETGAAMGLVSLVERTPRPHTATLHGDAVVVVLERGVYRRLLAELNPLAVRLQQQVARQLSRQLRRLNLDLTTVLARPASAAASSPWAPPPPQPGTGPRPSVSANTPPPMRPEDLPEHIRRALRGVAGRVHAPTGPVVVPPAWATATPAPVVPPAEPGGRGDRAPPAAGENASLADILKYLERAAGPEGAQVKVVPTETGPRGKKR